MIRTLIDSKKRLTTEGKGRRAVVTVMVLVVLMLLSSILAQVVRRAVADRRQIRQETHQHQAIELAFAGLSRMQRQLQADGNYSGETWAVPAGQIHQTNSGLVEISFTGDSAKVIARYPSNLEHAVQVTKTVSISQ